MTERVRKPEWLKISIGANERYTETKRIVESHCLHTICSSGRCPNMGECWGRGTATFMIGGDICTRCCKFCNTQTGKPMPLDPKEPVHVAESADVKPACLTEVMSGDNGAERVKNYSVPMAAGLSYNYASKQVDEDVLSALEKLADRKSTRLNSSHTDISRMPSSA